MGGESQIGEAWTTQRSAKLVPQLENSVDKLRLCTPYVFVWQRDEVTKLILTIVVS